MWVYQLLHARNPKLFRWYLLITEARCTSFSPTQEQSIIGLCWLYFWKNNFINCYVCITVNVYIYIYIYLRRFIHSLSHQCCCEINFFYFWWMFKDDFNWTNITKSLIANCVHVTSGRYWLFNICHYTVGLQCVDSNHHYLVDQAFYAVHSKTFARHSRFVVLRFFYNEDRDFIITFLDYFRGKHMIALVPVKQRWRI